MFSSSSKDSKDREPAASASVSEAAASMVDGDAQPAATAVSSTKGRFKGRIRDWLSKHRDANVRCFNVSAPFPELDKREDNDLYVERAEKPIGVCFSGGGTRAASLGMGQLRALVSMPGIWNEVGHVSGVSGGSWISWTFLWLPEEVTYSSFFGGAPLSPASLTPRDLVGKAGSFNDAVTSQSIPKLVAKVTTNFLRREQYSRMVAEWFMHPFHISTNTQFTFNEASSERLMAAGFEDVMHCPRSVPFPIAGAMLMLNDTGVQDSLVPVEYTASYVGCRKFIGGSDLSDTIGGGYVEACGYDTPIPVERGDEDAHRSEAIIKVSILKDEKSADGRFTLHDVIGSSGAAPQLVIDSGLLFEKALLTEIFPDFRHWSPHMVLGFEDANKIKETKHATVYGHTDGGVAANLGIMPLLARKKPFVISFVNAATPWDPVEGNSDVRRLFESVKLKPYSVRAQIEGDYEDFTKNIVFAEAGKGEGKSQNSFQDLNRQMAEARAAGRPMVAHGTYHVIRNDDYGIEGGYDVKVIWVLNYAPKCWVTGDPEKPPEPTTLDGVHGQFSFEPMNPEAKSFLHCDDSGEELVFEHDMATFPCLSTFAKLVMTSKESASLSHLGTFNTMYAASLIRQFFEMPAE